MKKNVVFSLLLAMLVFCGPQRMLAQTEQKALDDDRARALELYDQNNFKDARPILEKLVEQLPKDAVVHERLGMCILADAAGYADPEQRKTERARARKVLLKAKELGDDSNLLQILLEGIPEDGTTVSFSEHKEIDAIMRDAEAAFGRGDLKAAIDGYMKAIVLDPNLYSAALFAGDAYYKQKMYGSAAEWFSRAIQIDPNAETAYRYWGDALMAQGRMQEAREKFIDAVVAEPYRRVTWIGAQQWADRQGLKIAHPDVHQSTKFEETSPTQMNITLDPAGFKAKDGSGAWMFYGISRAAWHGERFKKEFPDEKEYRHSLKEEADSLKMVADMVSEDVKAKKIKKVEPGLAVLTKIKDDGLLEAFVLLTRPDAGIAKDYAAYREKNREKLRRYLDEYVIPKLPAQ